MSFYLDISAHLIYNSCVCNINAEVKLDWKPVLELSVTWNSFQKNFSRSYMPLKSWNCLRSSIGGWDP